MPVIKQDHQKRGQQEVMDKHPRGEPIITREPQKPERQKQPVENDDLPNNGINNPS